MTALTISLACVAAIAVVMAGLALLALRRSRRESEREVDMLRRQLSERLDAVEWRLSEQGPEPARPDHEYVITHLGELETRHEDESVVPVRLTAPAFADAVLRESVVQTASLVHGLRRALNAETRNRIRFEMRREVKRSRKARKAELKVALREYRDRQRAEVAGAEVARAEVAGTEGAA